MSRKNKIILCTSAAAAVIIATIILGITVNIFSLRSVFGFAKVRISVSHSSDTTAAEDYSFITRADSLSELLTAKSDKLGFTLSDDGSFKWNDETKNSFNTRRYILRYVVHGANSRITQHDVTADELTAELIDEREYVLLLIETNALIGG